MARTVHAMDHSHNGVGEPLVGALLRRPFLAVRNHIVDALHEAGFTDLAGAHLAVFQYPGPDGRSPGDLARSADSTKQAINNLLAQLERAGYLQRDVNPANRRERVIRLTARGRRVISTIRDAVAEIESSWRRALGSDAYAQLRALLEQLNAVITTEH
jgi:DNA-binding MarR family transcriptional regulator